MDRMVIELGLTMSYQLSYKKQIKEFADDLGTARIGGDINLGKRSSAIRMAELNADDSDKLTLKTSPGLG